MQNRKRRDGTLLLAVSLALLIVFCGAYLIYNYVYLPKKTESDNARYAAMYEPQVTASPAAVGTPSPSPAVTSSRTPSATMQATAAPAANIPEDIKLGTPDADTIMYIAATLPPVRESFSELLRANPETVGFIRTADGLALPVVQRPGDNEYYLGHDFEDNASSAGTLFVDGSNRIFPRDECIYIYGHNMKNGTMFGELDDMATVNGLIAASPVRFDTLYADGVYIPFACFRMTADQSDRDYFEIRHFDLDSDSYGEFVAGLKKRSLLDIPVDAIWGDDILILVTCNYTIDDGRFIVAFRRLRDGETEENAMRLVELSTPK